MTTRIPRATYRLQFNRDFTFAQAADLVPYLDALGISHAYASPYLRARSGSPHGYDIVEHNELNPDIGDWDSYDAMVDALQARGMGQILDIVPNHMGVGGDDNNWWLDVLENGPASPYSAYFDIDWQPARQELRGKVLVPVLGGHYGTVLERGDLPLTFDAERGEFSVRYYEHKFPIDPRSYPMILRDRLEELAQSTGPEDTRLLELQSLITAFEHLPSALDEGEAARTERIRDKEIFKRRLAGLCRDWDALTAHLDGVVRWFNGTPGDPDSFEPLHQLLEAQAYRLAYWQVASDEINYRRFFDINDLAGLRTENPEVFETTHALILQLVREGKVNGLRIDHPDGLYDPQGYYRRLQARLSEAVGGQTQDLPCYVVVEKILAGYEYLPEEWPVFGTTGYDFAYVVNGMFVNPVTERSLSRLYLRFIGHELDLEELLYERKRFTVRVALSSELTVLTNILNRIAQAARDTRDFTTNGLREAITEVVACFPVYRTYVTGERVSDEDRRYVDWAIALAKKRSPAADISIFDFLRNILVLELGGADSALRERALRFAMKFQQYSAPVMAKAMEDTAFYIYNRLVSLNEVGGDPRRFGLSVGAFHKHNQERLRRWPHGMLATSTHDNKRSEDVRARINVISELPDEWRKHLMRWARINRSKKRILEQRAAPSRNDEYLFYQVLLGAWPLEEVDEAGLAALRERFEAYMLKAVKEAKVHTSWINPNTNYEEAVRQFVGSVLASPDKNPFLADFLPFQQRVAWFGLFNSLSQVLLKLAAPGVPDIYQGNEIWDFSLVDPDNRRPVDYPARQRLLDALRKEFGDAPADQAVRARRLLDTMPDGRAKLYLTWKTLTLRRAHPMLFEQGDYSPLQTEGSRAEHLCAFARRQENLSLICVVPRLFARLTGGQQRLPLGEAIWADTWVLAPNGGAGRRYRNVLTGETLTAGPGEGQAAFAAEELFRHFPVALLISESG